MTPEGKVLLWCLGAGLTPVVVLLLADICGAWRADRILSRRLREDIERREADARRPNNGGLR